MNADEIRKTADNFDANTPLDQTGADDRFQGTMLAEIAAQLATANALIKLKLRLDLYGPTQSLSEELEKL